MTPPELCRTPATELSAAIRAKQLSPVELVEVVLDRIEAVNPAINAFLAVDGERALESARAAEAAVMRGDELGLLHGLPVPIKDLEPSAGLRHTSGSILNTDHIADSDGIVTERVKAAGGIVIGKTNTRTWATRICATTCWANRGAIPGIRSARRAAPAVARPRRSRQG